MPKHNTLALFTLVSSSVALIPASVTAAEQQPFQQNAVEKPAKQGCQVMEFVCANCGHYGKRQAVEVTRA